MSDEQTTTEPTIDATAQALIEQVWGAESGPGTAPAAEPETAVDAPVEPEAPKVEEPAKDPQTEKVAARIAIAKRAELRAAEERKAQAAEREALAKQKAELAERTKQLELLEAAKLSPSKLLELAGKSPKDFLEALASEHEPEEVAKRAVAGTQTEVQRLAAELEALKAERAAERKARLDAEADAEVAKEGEAFVEFVAANVDKYPALVEAMTPDEFVSAALSCLYEVIGKDRAGNPVSRLQAYQAEHGRPPSNEEVAEFLEYQAQPKAQARTAWRARLGHSAQSPGQGTPNGQAAATPTDQGPGPRTLTSRDASVKASGSKPWSQEAADEESLRILRAAMR